MRFRWTRRRAQTYQMVVDTTGSVQNEAAHRHVASLRTSTRLWRATRRKKPKAEEDENLDGEEAAAARAARAKLQGVAPAELRGVAMAVEPNEVFLARLRRFCYWLDARPEQRIAVVAHWGVFYSLLGRSLKNCELVRMRSDELPAELTDSPGD